MSRALTIAAAAIAAVIAGPGFAANTGLTGYQKLDPMQVQMKLCLAEAVTAAKGPGHAVPVGDWAGLLQVILDKGKLGSPKFDDAFRACMWNADYVTFPE